MEHHLRPELPEHVVQSRLLPHVSDHRDEVKPLEPLLKLEAEVVHRGLAVVEQHEPLRAERRQLAAELGTDRSGGARHHHGLAAEVLHYRLHVQPYLLAAEKVLDLNLADRRLHDTAVYHLVDGRDHEHLHLSILAVLHEAAGFLLDFVFPWEEDGIHEEPLAEETDVAIVLEVEDLDTAYVLTSEPLAEVQVAYHVVVRGVRKARHRGNGLVVDPIDHHVGPLPRGYDLLAKGVVGDDHHDAHHQEEDDRQGHVHQRKDGVICIKERESDHHEHDTERLQEGGDAYLRELLKRRVPNDRAISAQTKEEHKREAKGQGAPREGEARGERRLPQEEAAEQKHADRRRQGHKKVDR